MRTFALFAAALAVLFFAPWSTVWTFILSGVAFLALLFLAIVSHACNVVPPDSEDMDRRRDG
jgi:hypothetical protein